MFEYLGALFLGCFFVSFAFMLGYLIYTIGQMIYYKFLKPKQRWKKGLKCIDGVTT